MFKQKQPAVPARTPKGINIWRQKEVEQDLRLQEEIEAADDDYKSQDQDEIYSDEDSVDELTEESEVISNEPEEEEEEAEFSEEDEDEGAPAEGDPHPDKSHAYKMVERTYYFRPRSHTSPPLAAPAVKATEPIAIPKAK